MCLQTTSGDLSFGLDLNLIKYWSRPQVDNVNIISVTEMQLYDAVKIKNFAASVHAPFEGVVTYQ